MDHVKKISVRLNKFSAHLNPLVIVEHENARREGYILQKLCSSWRKTMIYSFASDYFVNIQGAEKHSKKLLSFSLTFEIWNSNGPNVRQSIQCIERSSILIFPRIFFWADLKRGEVSGLKSLNPQIIIKINQ